MANIDLRSINGVTLDSDNPVPMRLIDTEVPTTMPPQGVTTVTTAGTRVQLVVTSTPLARGGVYIIPFPTNTGVIYVGGSGVTSSNGIRIGAGMILPFAIDDANKIYIDASVSGEGVTFVGI